MKISHELLPLLSFPKGNRGVSSVGSERLLDRQEVTGSIPVHPTDKEAYPAFRQLLTPFLISTTETILKQFFVLLLLILVSLNKAHLR